MVPVVVAAREGILDRAVYDAPKGELTLAGGESVAGVPATAPVPAATAATPVTAAA
ncbi:hypothetical protein ABH926_007920 [Catenulispora sp. GP43]